MGDVSQYPRNVVSLVPVVSASFGNLLGDLGPTAGRHPHLALRASCSMKEAYTDRSLEVGKCCQGARKGAHEVPQATQRSSGLLLAAKA